MPKLVIGVVILVVAGVVAAAIFGAMGGYPDRGDFKVTYGSATTQSSIALEQMFKNSRAFETIADALNGAFALPTDITIILGEVGTVNAFYDPGTKQILMGYEIIAYFNNSFSRIAQSEEELGRATMGATLFVFFHETGHALVDVYTLPITGKEEDAVDQVSTLILLEAGDEGETALLDSATWFYLRGQEVGVQNLPYWGVHALDMQRFYNIIAWVYGKNPQKYSYLVEQGILPAARAQTAQYEYQQMYNSWSRLLEPYIKK